MIRVLFVFTTILGGLSIDSVLSAAEPWESESSVANSLAANLQPRPEAHLGLASPGLRNLSTTTFESELFANLVDPQVSELIAASRSDLVGNVVVGFAPPTSNSELAALTHPMGDPAARLQFSRESEYAGGILLQLDRMPTAAVPAQFNAATGLARPAVLGDGNGSVWFGGHRP
jgi:hypothetical protein